MELEKPPVPVLSEVWLSLMVGLAEVLQHTPFAGTEAPPSDVTFPPLVAVVEVMEDGVVVVTVGVVVLVANETSLPYALPAELVA